MTAEVVPFGTVGTGPRNARTDPESGLRFYTWEGRELPSVTTIRRLAGLPHGLHQWALSQVIDRAVDNFDDLTAMLTRDARPRERVVEKNRRREAAIWLRAAATDERDLAAELGIAVHDAAARNVALEEAEPAVQPRLRQYLDWIQKSRAQIIASEFQVWNLTEGYAGTADLLVDFPTSDPDDTRHRIWLIDLKTGKGTYAEHALQLIDYRTAEFVGADDRKDDRLTFLLKRCEGMAILHLADDGWEFRAIRFDEETLAASRGLLRFALWMHTNPRVEDVTTAVRKGSA